MGPRAPTSTFCLALGFPTLKPPSLLKSRSLSLSFPSPPLLVRLQNSHPSSPYPTSSPSQTYSTASSRAQWPPPPAPQLPPGTSDPAPAPATRMRTLPSPPSKRERREGRRALIGRLVGAGPGLGSAAAVCVAEADGAHSCACGKPGSLGQTLTPVVGDAFLGGEGVVVSFAVCKLQRLDGRGTIVVPRKGLRPENFEWGLGTGKRKGQSRVTWTGEASVGIR